MFLPACYSDLKVLSVRRIFFVWVGCSIIRLHWQVGGILNNNGVSLSNPKSPIKRNYFKISFIMFSALLLETREKWKLDVATLFQLSWNKFHLFTVFSHFFSISLTLTPNRGLGGREWEMPGVLAVFDVRRSSRAPSKYRLGCVCRELWILFSQERRHVSAFRVELCVAVTVKVWQLLVLKFFLSADHKDYCYVYLYIFYLSMRVKFEFCFFRVCKNNVYS